MCFLTENNRISPQASWGRIPITFRIPIRIRIPLRTGSATPARRHYNLWIVHNKALGDGLGRFDNLVVAIQV